MYETKKILLVGQQENRFKHEKMKFENHIEDISSQMNDFYNF